MRPFNSVARDLSSDLTGIELGRRGFLREILPFLFYSSRILGQKSRSFNLNRCLRDLKLHSLEMPDWLTDCFRSYVYGTALLKAPCASPIVCPAIPIRPSLSISIATLYPCPRLPVIFSSGILRSSKLSVQALEARLPSFCSFLAI